MILIDFFYFHCDYIRAQKFENAEVFLTKITHSADTVLENGRGQILDTWC